MNENINISIGDIIGFSIFALIITVFVILGSYIISLFQEGVTKQKKELAEIYINSEKYEIFDKCFFLERKYYCMKEE